MKKDLAAIVDFVMSNRDILAAYVRRELIEAGAKSYVDQLGVDGIRQKEAEAAGVLLDFACALARKLDPGCDYEAEEVWNHLPEHLRSTIRLPRSEAYDNVMDGLAAMVRRRESEHRE